MRGGLIGCPRHVPMREKIDKWLHDQVRKFIEWTITAKPTSKQLENLYKALEEKGFSRDGNYGDARYTLHRWATERKRSFSFRIEIDKRYIAWGHILPDATIILEVDVAGWMNPPRTVIPGTSGPVGVTGSVWCVGTTMQAP